MDHSELKKQQEIQLKMLVDFDKFCKKYDLKYFMIYGTLLGAVRHKGFIPWDYDIDTAMTRTEYEKFKAIKKELPSYLSIWEVCYSDIDHAGLARLLFNVKDLGSVHIDIFILDYEKKVRHDKLRKYLTSFLHFAKLSKNEKSILLKHFTGNPIKQSVIYFSKVINLLVGGSASVERLIYKLRVSNVPTENYITLEDNIKFPIKNFNEPILLPFDGQMFYAPNEPEELLKIMYGNYMEIPAEGHLWMQEEGFE